MRVVLERSNLLKSLGHVQRVVERRNTIPILSNVLLRARDGRLTLKATDLDLEVTEDVAAAVEVEGSTTVPAHMLYDIVRKLPDGAEVKLAEEDGTMKLSAGRSQFQLQVLPETDFPDLTAGTFEHAFKIAPDAMKALIDRTQFAISTEETRYYLNGIYLHAVDGEGGAKLRAVATDGHRLAQAEVEAPEGTAGMPSVIVPRKTVGELQKLLDNAKGEVGVEVSEAKIRITLSDGASEVVLTSKLIDGTFPDYNRVIPTGNEKQLRLDRETFARAVDRVSTIASDRGRAVKMSMDDGQLTLSVNNPDSGFAEEELPVGYEADKLDIGFNSRYLLDITGQLTADETTFWLADPGSPTLIRDAAKEGGEDASPIGALYVLMPMRV